MITEPRYFQYKYIDWNFNYPHGVNKLLKSEYKKKEE